MVGISERNKQRQELVSVGFSMDWIDQGRTKVTLYRHKASYNAEGNISEDVGSTVKGVPGSPDYVLLKAKIGLFPWVPSESCECQWCNTVEEPEKADVPESLFKCPHCKEVITASNAQGAAMKLRTHIKDNHPDIES